MVRKMPNTKLWRDREMSRLTNYQGVETSQVDRVRKMPKL